MSDTLNQTRATLPAPPVRKKTTMPSKMMLHSLPTDPDLLASFGRISLRHAFLDRILQMTIKTLSEVSVGEALAASK